mmetsp:Transcript_33617/g.66129  ORF Transcript_33617/g.66129 Transcript_33617/m.66129 type:complete len:594 (+) Transcript_33617:81-1862(+)
MRSDRHSHANGSHLHHADLSVGRHWGLLDGRMWLPEVAYRWHPDDLASHIYLLLDFVCPVGFLLLLVLWSHCAIRHSMYLDAAEANVLQKPINNTGQIQHNICFAWWNRKKVSKIITLLQASDPVDLVQPEWSTQALQEVLESCGCPLTRWSDAATDALADELATGRSRLTLHEGRPVRCVELILLVIEHTRGRRILQLVQNKEIDQSETVVGESEKAKKADSQVNAHGGIGEKDNVDATKDATEEAVRQFILPPLPELVPATRRIVGEHVVHATNRCLTKKLGIPPNAVRVHEGLISIHDEVEDLDCFPDLRSFVRKFLVYVEVTTFHLNLLQGLGLYAMGYHAKGGATQQETVKLGKRVYRWTQPNPTMQVSQYFHGSRYLSNRYSSDSLMAEPPPNPQTGLPQEGPGGALLPWTQQSVRDLLKVHDVPLDKTEARYGLDLPQLAAELQKGRLALGVRASDNRLLCFEDVFSLLITTTTAEVLVQLLHEGSEKSLGKMPQDLHGHLPCAIRLVGEDAWAITRRIACGQLNIMCRDLIVPEQIVQEVIPGNAAQHVLGGLWPHCGQNPDFVLREFVVLVHVSSPDRVTVACS